MGRAGVKDATLASERAGLSGPRYVPFNPGRGGPDLGLFGCLAFGAVVFPCFEDLGLWTPAQSQ